MARINRDDVDKLYDYDIYIPSRTIYMGSTESSITDGESGTEAVMAERVIKALHLLDQKDEPITIIMNNPGGDWYHGMAIYDAIKSCKSHVTVKGYGYIMSMGAVIMQAADNRIIAPNAKLMIHYGYAGWDGHAKTFQKWAKEFKKIDEDMEQIFLEKMLEKDPNITIDDVKKVLEHDTFYKGQEAVDVGLADEVL